MSRKSMRAFTLIELLVVISIIALLIGILLPALGAAREAGRSAACKSNERQLAVGMTSYSTENRGDLPGPNTSGAEQSRQNNNYVFQNTPDEPTYNMDWVSPSLGRELGLPKERFDRMQAIFDNEFRCPNNDLTTESFPSGGAQLRYSSYSAAVGFHMRDNPNIVDPVDADGQSNAENPFASGFPELAGTFTHPTNYSFKLESVRSASDKVFAMEGARFLNSENPVSLTYNTFVRQLKGGNFMTAGPALSGAVVAGSPHRFNGTEATAGSREVAYRHSDSSMNVVFFDGHVEQLSDEESLDASLYLPSGTVIDRAAATADPNDNDGDVLR